jgi:putative membrane-bound dehydrogenase-like protein
MKFILFSFLAFFTQFFIADTDKMYVPDDMEVELWAESPLFYNPTNMDVDAKGRIWVTEAVEYRDFNNDPDKRFNFKGKGDRVVILEDTDGDGKADKSKVFAQDIDIVAPLGIAVMGDKIIVSSAPNVIVYTDADHDDVPEKKEIFLTGFGGKDHDHSLHSFIATPYSKYLFNVGNAGPHEVTDKAGWKLSSGTLYTGGSPYNEKNSGNRKSSDGRVWVGGLALEIEPDATKLKVLAHNFRNSYEVVMDSYGNMWQNDNDDQVIACRTSWLMEGSNAGFFSKDGTRYWNGDRRPGQDIFAAHWHQEDPNVLPVTFKTGAGSPTGMMVYEGNAFGDKYKGMVLSCEAGRNVVFGYTTNTKNAGFEMKSFDLIGSAPSNNEFYLWNDDFENQKSKWFRPSDAVTGTDGAIYVADWYDSVVGGHQMKDKEGKGRIYRIRPKNKKLSNPVLDYSTISGLINVMKSPANNVRFSAYHALKNIGEKAIPEVEKLLSDPNDFIKARGIYLLAELGEKGKEKVKQILKSEKGELQIAAFRALKKQGIDPVTLSEEVIGEPNMGLKREIAISLRDVDYQKSKALLLKLADSFDGKDRNFLVALGIGIDSKVESFYTDYSKKLPLDALKYSAANSGILFELHAKATAKNMALRAGSSSLSDLQRKEALTTLAFINTAEAVNAMLKLSKSSLKDVAAQAEYWVSFKKSNDWQNLVSWKALDQQLLTPSQKNMIKLKDELLAKTTKEARLAIIAEKMALDSYGGKLILAEAASGKLSSKAKEALNVHIFNNPDLSIRSMAADYFNRPGGSSLSLEIAANMNEDSKAGKTIFQKNCANCHKMGENGMEIGPDLTLIGKKFDKRGLLDAIINPSAGLAFGYEPWIVNTADNTYYGFLMGDGTNVTIKDLTGKLNTIKTKDIKSKTQLKNSLMPDPTSMGLKEKDLSDLTGYLRGL